MTMMAWQASCEALFGEAKRPQERAAVSEAAPDGWSSACGATASAPTSSLSYAAMCALDL